MSNAIPPLLCSTPPPIEDFGNNNEKDDDFGGFDSNEFHQFNGPSLPTTPRHDLKKSDEIPDLPIPDDNGFPSFSAKSISCDTKSYDMSSPETNDINLCMINESKLNKNPAIKVEHNSDSEINLENLPQPSDQEENQYEENISDMLKSETLFHKTNKLEENTEKIISSAKSSSRSESPQSLELSAENLSSEDNESVGDFQEAELKYDDNTSLPSLNFDSINISKNSSPNFQQDKPSPNESPTKEVEENINSSAFQMTVDSCQNTNESYEKTQTDKLRNTEYCEENAELDDDFNDFASASITENINTAPLGKIILKPGINNDDNDGNSDTKSPSSLPIDDSWNNDDNDFNDFEAFTSGPSICNNIENIDSQATVHAVEVKSEPAVFSADFNHSQSLNDKIVLTDDGKLSIETMQDNQFKTIANEVLNEELFESKDEDIVRETFHNTEIDDGFEDFQEFASSVIKSNDDQNPDNINADAVHDDDDDFGDFSDFKEAPQTVELVNPFTSLQFTSLDDRLKPILNMMFPGQEDGSNIKSKGTNADDINNNLISNLKEVEAAKALEYQWSNSNIKHSLIKALGIDSRNILYGEKWNSSMPKFASNLGFSPLEPLKPVQINGGTATGVGTLMTSGKGETMKRSGNEVPAVQFDWNSSGLVNPLDGVKEILHERKAEKIYQAGPSNIDQHSEPQSSVEMTVSSSSSSNHEISSVIIPKDTNSISVCTDLSEFNNNLNVDINLSEDKENTNNHKTAITENIINNVTADDTTSSLRTKSSISSTYVVPLKETHIFTPSKGENTIARSVKSCDTKCPIDFDYEMAAAGIIIDEQVVKKEYRDIEYNPEKLTFDIGNGVEGGQAVNEFVIESSYERYRGVNDASSNIIINENLATIPSLDNNNKNTATNFQWDFDSPTNSKSDEPISSDSFTDFQSGPNTITEILSSMTSSDQPNKPLDITTELKINTDNTTIANGFCDFTKTNKYSTGSNYNFSKPTIGISPTENTTNNIVQGIVVDSKPTTTKTTTTSNNSFDDEFSDFQSVPPPLPTSQQHPVQIQPPGTSISSNIDPGRIKSFSEEKPKSRTETPTFSDEMILSPAVLLPQSIQIESNPQINWPEPGINPDELARLEELFPQAKQTKQSPIRINQQHHHQHHQSTSIPQSNDQPKEQKNSITNDDDDWSEFVSVPIAQNSISSINKRTTQQQQQQPQSITSLSISKLVNTSPNDDDDWSDFVSSEPTTGSNYSSWNSINHIPPSQYSSWHQSQHLPKQYFQQGQLYQQQHQQKQQQPQQQHQPSNLVPTTNPNNVYQINNNTNLGQSFFKGYSVVSGNPHHQNFQLHQQFQPGLQQQQQQPQQQHQQQHQQRNQPQAVLKSQLNKAPSISLIPDLGFVAPRNFINVPRNNFGKK